MPEKGKHAAVLPRLLEIGRALTHEARFSEVLQRIMDAAIEVTGAERGFLCLLENGRIEVAVARNLNQQEVQDAQRKLSQSVIQRVVSSGEPLVSIDAPKDPRLAGSRSVAGMHIRSVACIPLRLRPAPLPGTPEAGEPAVIGCVYLDHCHQAEQFAEADVELLELFGAHAALALQAVRLLEMLQQRNARLNSRLLDSESQLSWTRSLLREALADAAQRHELPGIVYVSRSMHQILGLLKRVADHDLPILFTGESGTGKEVLARAVHAIGGRSEGPFVAVNCGAIPPELFESEFFGHRRGAFTGADRDRIGLIESARGGTLFLDEVADLSMQHQVKLLRALQEGEVRRVGEDVPRRVDFRVLSATNKDVEQEIQEGRFREDLYYRLSVFRINIPPLRDRPEDVPVLVDAIIEQATGRPPKKLSWPSASDGQPVEVATSDGASRVEVDPEVYALLSYYGWPGNVRELENEVKRALALGQWRITPSELSPAVFQAPRRTGSFPALAHGAQTLEEIVAAVEREVIARALERNDGNKSRTAQELGISRNGLAMKMERLGIT